MFLNSDPEIKNPKITLTKVWMFHFGKTEFLSIALCFLLTQYYHHTDFNHLRAMIYFSFSSETREQKDIGNSFHNH